MAKKRVVILGAGPTGLSAAARLSQRGRAEVTLLEASTLVGGNAGSFDVAGLPVDYGSHRLHPSCDPDILHDLREMLGQDLAARSRHGRIRLRGRWIHFPLKPLDLALQLPLSFTAGVAADIALKGIHSRRRLTPADDFASVMEADLGRTISRDFYFPYSRKIWGLPPQELAAIQAQRRVSNNSLGKMMRKVLSAAPGSKAQRKGFFYYPRGGFGQICDAYLQAAEDSGVVVQFDSSVRLVETRDGSVYRVQYERAGREEAIEADFVWSTIPITTLVRALRPAPPDAVLRAASSIQYRAMILIYLVLEQERFTEYDAHYFPEESIPISRLSEPKNYHPTERLSGTTVLCAELPCSPDGSEWGMSDEFLGKLVLSSLERAGIPVQAPVREVQARRLRYAYPMYRRGYDVFLKQMDRYVHQVDGLLSFGRQGLFVHDNTHHALYMGYAAADCLGADGTFDLRRWQAYREVFESHVVED